VVAAIGTFAILFLLFIPAFLDGLVNDPSIKVVIDYLNLFQHMDEFGKGIVDTRHLIYYFSATAFCLFVTSRALEANKGR
jgi:ABC-2 type transport system permease protein